ncbi:MAG: restriction endonuclease subunit S [Eubacterium sp.]|jgi:type I restriction enzyme S subunit
MGNNKKVPAIRFKGFTDDWEQRKLDELARFTKGSGYSKADLRETGTPIILYGRLYTKYETIIKEVDTYAEAKDGSVYSQGGEVIVPASGETAEDISVASVIEKSGILIGGDLNIIHPLQELDPAFLAISVSTGEPHQDMTRRAQGKSVVHLHNEDLSQIELRFPSIVEQQEISRYFSNLDHLITLHQREHDKLLNVKKSMLEKMFPKNGEKVPEIRFKGFTGDWEQRKLGDMGTTFTGLSGKSKEDFGHGEAQFVTYMNVYSNPIADNNMTEHVEIDSRQNKVKYGDVFFTTSSETPDEVGMSSVWLENYDNTYLNSFCFGYRPEQKIEPYYLAYMLRSDDVRKKIIFLAQGISRYNISINRMIEIKIPLPNYDEQKRIGALFKSLDYLITLHQRKIEKLQNIKKSLLEKMFV